MIKSVTIVSDRDRAIRFDLQRPEKSGFAVIDIDGLGPTKNKINFSSDHALNTKHESSVPELRNITIKLQYYGLPDDIEKNRRKLYTYFGVGRILKVIIHTGERILQTNGYTESLEPDIFSGDQTYNISIMCDSPYFKNAGEISNELRSHYYGMNSIENVFEFPFSNQVGTKSLEMSRLNDSTRNDGFIYVINDGDIDIGFKIKFYPYKSKMDDRFFMQVNGVRINFDSQIMSNIANVEVKNANTYVEVNTNDGFRKIVVAVKDSSSYKEYDITVMMYVTNQKVWPQLIPGENELYLGYLFSSYPTIANDIEYIKGDRLYLGV